MDSADKMMKDSFPCCRNLLLKVLILFILLEKSTFVECDPDKEVFIQVSADAVYEFPFAVQTNHFEQMTRLVSNETMTSQQAILIYEPVDGDPDSFKEFLDQQYCSQLAFNAPRESCLLMMKSVFNAYIEHCKKENFTLKIEAYSTQVIDVGFSKRLKSRNERLRRRYHEQYLNTHTMRYKDILASDISISRETECHRKNCGGNFATLVTGYWDQPVTKYHNSIDHLMIDSNFTTQNPYLDWFNNSLHINMPYIVFSGLSSLGDLLPKRKNLPTLFVPYDFDGFYVKDDILIPQEWTIGNKHIPSRDLSRIWMEKMNLVKLASQLDTNATYYVWIDAGLPTYRHLSPPNEEWSHEVLLSLPKDRISYCQVEGEYHRFAAGVIVFPRAMVKLAHYLFYRIYKTCLTDVQHWHCGSEQFIWTDMHNRYPEMFHVMAYNYGDIAFLWGSMNQKLIF